MKCMFGTSEVSCGAGTQRWSHAAQAWCNPSSAQPTPGETLYRCTRPNGALVPDANLTFDRVLTPAEAAPTVDPAAVARKILTQIQLEAIDIGIHPRGDSTRRMGYVGWNTWLWADSPDSRQWGSVSSSLAEGGVTVSLTATATSVHWDMGDGTSFTCDAGTPWSEARTGGKNVKSPDCGHVYTKQGTYTVSATTEWDVQWQGGGASGTIPFSLTRTADVMVGELQSVVTG
ncbi:MAG TPA: PKD domain-containing protein [Tessaracoccus flavescens]|uniref:PKD domain-containing protein n=1 Tax=Tessaracoccus flavescens TaxID=399497 RepID=A0A921ELJ6_9ACTN|nr:PKD domain-containing protein [Tessaracoccus flavescens]